mmetsp:Transcript_39305/g.98311  ORF Transcript_39305/g.98311 Transcript_39305/m.98311 type:complete len:136 (-) Transcript_39305:198-605(-)
MPCAVCLAFLHKMHIPKIAYSTNDGDFSVMRLRELLLTDSAKDIRPSRGYRTLALKGVGANEGNVRLSAAHTHILHARQAGDGGPNITNKQGGARVVDRDGGRGHVSDEGSNSSGSEGGSSMRAAASAKTRKGKK